MVAVMVVTSQSREVRDLTLWSDEGGIVGLEMSPTVSSLIIHTSESV